MSRQKKIMVVDDEAGIRNLLFEVLSGEGFRVKLAKDGQDSIDKMKNHHFDLLLTDLNMPRMDGIDLLRTMKKKRRKEIIIIMTGESFRRPFNGKDIPHVEEILKKPFHMNKLIETVAAVLYSRKKIKKLPRSSDRRRKAVNVA